MMFTNIKRLGGTDRYDTNMLIVNEVNVPQSTPVFIASGKNFPDALSISSVSGSKQYPTLLVGADYLPERTKNYLLNEKPSAVYIAGGTSVVSQVLESQINALVLGSTVTRLAGDDRFGTNVAVLKEFSPAPDTIYIGSGDDFQDVLSGSALAAKTGNPIILVDTGLSILPPAVEAYLKKLNGSRIQPNIISLGGTDVISDILCQQVENSFSDRGINDSKGKPQINVNPRIAAGRDTAYYVDSSGHVWAWGEGNYGYRSLLPDLRDTEILELGCGFGESCKWYVTHGAKSVIGLDISDKMITRAKQLFSDKRIEYINMPIEELAFEPEKFDLVLSSLVLHYVADFQNLLKRIYFCLKPGGLLIFSQEHPIATAKKVPNGWVKDENGANLHWVIDNYSEEGIR